MESKPISNILVPYTNKDLLQKLDTDSKNVVQSVVQTLNNNSVVSVNDLNSRMVCIFKQINNITFAKLKEIYLLGDKILKINVKLLNKSLVVEIKKDVYKRQVTIKHSRPNMVLIEKCTEKILKSNGIEKSDYRICYEIVKLIFKWTWGKLAANIKMEVSGGEYTFTVSNLRVVDYNQLSALDKVHDAVHSIQINFIRSLLTFKVTRTKEYINQHESKKRRRDEW